METQKASEIAGFPDAVIKILSQPIDPAALSPAPRGLTSIKSIYITERLNQAFGLARWYVHDEIVEIQHPMVVVKVHMELTDYPWFRAVSYGGNNNPDLGDAYKGAVSDAISKICAMYLGVAIDVFKGLSAPENGNGNGNGNGHKPAAKPEVQRVSTTKVDAPPAAKGSKDVSGDDAITEGKVKRFKACVFAGGKDWDEVGEKLASVGLSSIEHCPWKGELWKELCAWAEGK